MDSSATIAAGLVVALVGRAPRLRRVLRLALEDADYHVLEGESLALPWTTVAAVVVDLDSLGLRPAGLLSSLRTRGLAAAAPLVLVSVYPPEGALPAWRGPLEYLQPPFAPAEIVYRIRRALDR